MTKIGEKYLEARGRKLHQVRKTDVYNKKTPYQEQANDKSKNIPICYNCNKTGHLSKDGKAPKKIHLNSDLKCFGCGKTRHLRINCPVKKISLVGATEEQEEGNNIIGTCGAGSVFPLKMDLEPQHSSTDECIREDLLLANGKR